jgi:sucrose-phosphate synthase
MTETRESGQALHVVLISIHGLIRGKNLELGRDPDTGGQTLYVVELARALGERRDVARVDLFTQRIEDPTLSPDYSRCEELLSDHARIVRLDLGLDRYTRKEGLWDYLDIFADNMVNYFQENDLSPDVLHAHYADAGYVGVRVARQLALPLIFTGHSLGRIKRRRLLASGANTEEIEKRYNMVRRIEAEEETLAAADLVIASTANEITEQYERYDLYQPESMRVVPPGTDLRRFYPPDELVSQEKITSEVDRFLQEPEKPIVLSICRPDERKNISTLVKAYGGSTKLQSAANLVIVAGNRDDVDRMESSAARVLTDLLLEIDRQNLYGRVAYPKHHSRDDVPTLYRLAAERGGVFVNPALTEPFGLTLLEAAASGLPIVATEDGGPQDILGNCRNGILIDPLDPKAITAALLALLLDRSKYEEMARNGLQGVREHYSWQAHVEKYISELRPLLARVSPRPRPQFKRRPMLYHDRAIFSDLDQNLLGDPDSLVEFNRIVKENRQCATFGIATGRNLQSALKVIRSYGIAQPDVLITSVGTAIHYSPKMEPDTAWRNHINHLWTPSAIRRVLVDVPGLELQEAPDISRFKLSYYIDPEVAPDHEEIASLLRQNDQTVNTFLSFGQYLDIVPVRASKGAALRWFAEAWDIPLEQILAAGGSGTDEDMMRGNTLAVVVANRHEEELSALADIDNIYYAKKGHAAGIVEAIEHYDFYIGCRIPRMQ